MFFKVAFKMRKPIMNIALILGMFPGFMSMIAVYYILKGINLVTAVGLSYNCLYQWRSDILHSKRFLIHRKRLMKLYILMKQRQTFLAYYGSYV